MNAIFINYDSRCGRLAHVFGAMMPSKSTSRKKILGSTRRGILRRRLLITGLVGVGCRATAASGCGPFGGRQVQSIEARQAVVEARTLSGVLLLTRRKRVRRGAEATAAFVRWPRSGRVEPWLALRACTAVGQPFWPALAGSRFLQAFAIN